MATSRARVALATTVTCFALGLGPLAAAGQPDAAVPAATSRLSGGLKGGFTLTNLGGDEAADGLDKKRGALIAGFLVFERGAFAVQAELALVSKGTLVHDRDRTGSMTFRYLEVPILLRLQGRPAVSRPFVVMGLAPAIRVSARSRAVIGTTEVSANLVDFTDELDVGLAGGAGFEYAVAGGALVFELRYTHGLVPIWVDGADVKHRAGLVAVGFRFR